MQPLLFILLLLCNSVMLSRGSHNVADAPSITVVAAAPGPAAASPDSSSSTPPRSNLITLMSKKGCKAFADLLTAGTGEAAKSFESTVAGGLTVFCPSDDALKPFLPKFKNLTADDELSLLLFHGVPVYYSLLSLKSSNGVMNTLATDGVARSFNFTVQNDGEGVAIRTAGPTARVGEAVVDKEPLAVYGVDQVLEPAELFGPAPVPAAAPSPVTEADAAAGKGEAAAALAPAGPEGEPSQKAADENAGGRVTARWWAATAMAVAVVATVS